MNTNTARKISAEYPIPVSFTDRKARVAARRRKRLIRQTLTGLVIISLSGTLLYTSIKYRAAESTYESNIVALTGQLTEAQENLQELQKELATAQVNLSKFTNPIQYSIGKAPIYTNIPLDAEMQQYTYELCSMYGIPDEYELVLAMMWQESHFDPSLVGGPNSNGTYDHGIMQINSVNHEDLKQKLNIVDIMEPKANIECGVYIISTLLLKYGDENKALMAYNMGPSGAAAQWERGNYSSRYSRNILDKAQAIKANNYTAD